MTQSPSSVPTVLATVAAATGAKLTQAEAELWCHTFGYLKSTALRCAINLGIPTAIHRLGRATSLSELHAALPVAPTKRPCLSRIMTFLSTSGIFTEETMIQQEEADPRYHLTTASRLLVDDDTAIASRTSCVSQLLTLCSSPRYFTASQNLAAWLKEEDDGAAAKARTPFAMAHNEGFYEVVRRDVAFGACFDEAMASDSRFVSEILVREYYGEVFAADGVRSVVDVGGHNGTTARAIAKAFPHVRCSVLELPRVVDAMMMAAEDGDGAVEFVAGDMREFIPPADAALFKCVLHKWSDEDCVQILKRSKEAVSTREPKGKVVITEVVLGQSPSNNKQTLEAQLLMDLCMMVVLEGKERTEETWRKIFIDAGFTRYKITPISGTTRSLIEVFP